MFGKRLLGQLHAPRRISIIKQRPDRFENERQVSLIVQRLKRRFQPTPEKSENMITKDRLAVEQTRESGTVNHQQARVHFGVRIISLGPADNQREQPEQIAFAEIGERHALALSSDLGKPDPA